MDILHACGLDITESNIGNVVRALEDSIIDDTDAGSARYRGWLVKGKDMRAFHERTKRFLQAKTVKLIDKYHEKIETS